MILTQHKNGTWVSILTSRILIVGVVVASALGIRVDANAQDGKALFSQVCGACHTIGEGKRVGPDLAGVTSRRSTEWLLAFIKSSQSMVNKGDPTAVALFNENNKLIMPDTAYDETQIRAVIDYIASQSPQSGQAAAAQAKPAMPKLLQRPATDEDIRRGESLFQGHLRFANGGPTCNSCHHVQNDAVIGGGVLAKDLTTVFSRMGNEGVQAILGSPPFPVMQQAYKNNPLEPLEVFSLVAFLQNADKQQAFQTPRDYGVKLLASGTGMFLGLMVLFAVWGSRRKKKSVNQEIYDRQVKSC